MGLDFDSIPDLDDDEFEEIRNDVNLIVETLTTDPELVQTNEEVSPSAEPVADGGPDLSMATSTCANTNSNNTIQNGIREGSNLPNNLSELEQVLPGLPPTSRTPSKVTLVFNSRVTSKPRRYCLNASCNDEGHLPLATSAELWYYGYENKKPKKWICTICAYGVVEYLRKVTAALKEHRPVCAIPTPFRSGTNMVIDLDDDDDGNEYDGGCNGEEDSSFAGQANLQNSNSVSATDQVLVLPIGTDIGAAIDACVKRLDLVSQKRMYRDWLNEQLNLAEKSLKETDALADKMQMAIYELVDVINRKRRPRYQVQMMNPLEIGADGNVQKTEATKNTQRLVSRRSTSGVPNSMAARILREFNQSSTSPTKLQDDDVIPLKRYKSVAAKRLELNPMKELIVRPFPRPGDRMYVMRRSSLEPWVLGTVLGVRESLFALVEYAVQLDRNPSSHKRAEIAVVSAKRLAYSQPLKHVVPVGTRVVAPFIDKTQPPSEDGRVVGSEYYAGVVAETPATQNRFRYLIFFDDGYAEYVSQHGLLLVSDSSPQVWADVHPHTQNFVREYLSRFPERRLQRLTRGAVTTIEWNQRAFAGRVLEVDASMVKICFEISKRVEWVYRGSNRFDKSLWKEQEQDQEKTKEQQRQQRQQPSTSTAGMEGNFNFATANTMNLPNSKPPTIKNTANLVEFEGRLVLSQRPPESKGILHPIPYSEHECRPGCAQVYDPASPILANVNPLLHPIYLGWDRETARACPRRTVYYRAPCGLRFRDVDEVQDYVFTTNCRLGIDLFSFDPSVEPYAEFHHAVQKFELPDLSYGKELVPIQCVNSISDQPPDYIEYTARRLPGKGVHINTDPGFMVCCDCTDDCLDRDKCACWQLTLEGTTLTDGPLPDVPIGYQERRLHDHVVSGIFECNKNCKCRSTCSNRVVQHPLRWKLQVFKTRTKGWAIRPLQDIPGGAFICIYSGQLLHENTANEDGMNYGDEYFAELDYIETTEHLKDGYEEEVVDPENPDKMTKNAAHKPRPPTRQFFGVDEQSYVMDAKTIGNIGRYMNHSCEPNVFVQNVFVDTHDLRFPWIAFFAYNRIRAGTELTWDYNYQVGSVYGKVMYCYCGSEQCRGRLL